jgi:hypothetical protein
MVADGTTTNELLDDSPQLSGDDVGEALRFAAANVDQRAIALDHSEEIDTHVRSSRACAETGREAHGWLTT